MISGNSDDVADEEPREFEYRRSTYSLAMIAPKPAKEPTERIGINISGCLVSLLAQSSASVAGVGPSRCSGKRRASRIVDSSGSSSSITVGTRAVMLGPGETGTWRRTKMGTRKAVPPASIAAKRAQSKKRMDLAGSDRSFRDSAQQARPVAPTGRAHHVGGQLVRV